MKTVKITWIDAESGNEWITTDELEEPSVCTTIGYLVKETDKFYFIAGTISIEEEKVHTNNRIIIPKPWVIELQEIKHATKKKTPKQSPPSESAV